MTGPNEDWCSRQRSRSHQDRYRRINGIVRVYVWRRQGGPFQTVRMRAVVLDPGHLTAIVLATKARSQRIPLPFLGDSVFDEACKAIRRIQSHYSCLELCHLQTSCPLLKFYTDQQLHQHDLHSTKTRPSSPLTASFSAIPSDNCNYSKPDGQDVTNNCQTCTEARIDEQSTDAQERSTEHFDAKEEPGRVVLVHCRSASSRSQSILL
jgi:hypothetical protein